ncbi:MAG: ATP-binding protein [Pseudomonadota bacterium]
MSIRRIARWRSGCALTLSLLALAVSSGAASAQEGPRRDAVALTIGVPVLGVPLAYRDENGEPAGVLIDYWRLAQRELGPLRISLCAAPGDCLADLEAGALDLAGPMAVAGASQAVTYTAPVLSLPVAGASRTDRGRDARLLTGARVGLVRGQGADGPGPIAGGRAGCLAEDDCAALARWSPASVLTVSASAASLDAALGSDVDVLVGAQPHLAAVLGDAPRVQMTELWRRWLYVAARTGDQDRLQNVEEILLGLSPAMLNESPGFAKAFGGVEALALPMDVPELSDEEKRFLDRHPALHLGAAVWEPLTVLEDDYATGLAIDSVRYHLKRLGVRAVFDVRDWPTVRAMADGRQLDGLGYVVSSRNLEDGQYALTHSVVEAPFVAALGPSAPFVGSVEEIVSLPAVMQRQYEAFLPVVRAAYPGLDLQLAATPREAVDALLEGRAQVWLDFLPIVRYSLAQFGVEQAGDVRTINLDLFERMSTALDPALTPMATLMNRSIDSAPVGLAAVQSRWLELTVEPEVGGRHRATDVALTLLTLALGGGCVLLLRQRMLQRARLQASEAALRRAQLLSGVGSLEVPPPYNRVLLTGDTGHLLGLPRDLAEQALDAHLALFEQEDATRLDQALESAWRAGYGNTVALTARDQRRFLYELAPPQSTQQQTASVLITLRDVTEQTKREERERALEHEVMERQKLDAVGRLAASIAHDFNNVLSVVLGSAELALRDVPEGHPAHKPIQQVLTAGLRSRELIGQMLNSVRPPARERQRVSLRAVVSDTLGLLSHGIPATVTPAIDLGDASLFVDGNDVQLRQVVGNLIRNAVDAMPQGGQLGVALSHEETSLGPRARLRVADTGVGMSEETLANCFEFFYTTRTEGTGLGLAIVRSLVTAHRGRVEVRSTVGEGTAFDVWLPLADEQEDPPPKGKAAPLQLVSEASAQVAPQDPDLPPGPAAQAGNLGSNPPHLLLVDDEREMLSAVSSGLRARGFRVTPVVGADAALAAVDRHRMLYDVVLTDLTMSGMSGVDLARELKRREPRLPVVLLAAGSEDPNALTGSRHIDRVLDKRISNDDLSGVLGELVYGYAAS